MNKNLQILILGGYGTFGGRIVELLESEWRLTLIIAGRSLGKAESYCRSRTAARALLRPLRFDRDGDVKRQLAELRPDLLVDASGPFQNYGDGQYRVIEACIALGVNYLDLADGSDFVAGVSAFDEAAAKAGCYVLSGVSSFPVLTAAVVRHLSSDLKSIDSIHGGIAPSPYAGVGENVIRAIASYAGQRIPMRRDGKAVSGYPFTDHRRFTVAPPGRIPLRNTLFSLVDVPDLRALTELWPEAKTVWMGAGPVPEILHRLLIGCAWLVRWRLIPTLLPLARLMHFATNRLRWGEHRGGMFVEIEGTETGGSPAKRSWHMLAEGDDGPLIPSMAVQALVRKVLNGGVVSPGARSAVRDLELADYEALFAGRRIHTGVRRERSGNPVPVYEEILGTAWNELPPQIRQMHNRLASASGRASVERGRTLPARIAAAMMGFPKASADISVRVVFTQSGEGEIWTRTFGDEHFSSGQSVGRGRNRNLLCERFGPLRFAMALVWNGERLSLEMRQWSAFGIPLPRFLCPRSESYEFVEDGKFHFNVDISHPLTGRIVRYRGWLEPEISQA